MKATIRKKIEEQLTWMHQFMDADESLCAQAGMSYDYWSYLNKNYSIIASRLGVTVDDVKLVDESLSI